MKSWQPALLGLALLTVAGCRTDPAVTLLERDNYRKDQEINRLKWQIEDLQDVLNSGQERSVGRDHEDRESGSGSHRNHYEPNGLRPPETERGTPTNKVPDAIRNPGGSLPSDIPEVPENIRGPTPIKSTGDGPALEGASDRLSSRGGNVSMTAGSAAIPFNPSGHSQRVASIVLDPAITGGIGAGDGSGDQGLLVAVEPRDAAGRIVDAPAEVNVTAFDRAMKGEAARVARWDFTPAETASLFRRTGDIAAIHLAMAWPTANPPKHRQLQLFVRYVTADGRKLEANQSIEIALPGDRTARWTPAETPRYDPQVERASAPGSWRPSDAPVEQSVRPAPYIASRTAEPNSDRPVWSPERR